MNGLKNEWGKVVWYESSALRETVTRQTSSNPLRMLNLRHRDTDPGECGSRNIDTLRRRRHLQVSAAKRSSACRVYPAHCIHLVSGLWLKNKCLIRLWNFRVCLLALWIFNNNSQSIRCFEDAGWVFVHSDLSMNL